MTLNTTERNSESRMLGNLHVRFGVGVGMQFPDLHHKIKRLAEHGRIVVFSSNYRLYGDMSNRVMKTLKQWTPHVEIYSIDEAFLDFTGLVKNDSVDSLMREITSTVKKWTGIPVSLGVGSTLTLGAGNKNIHQKVASVVTLHNLQDAIAVKSQGVLFDLSDKNLTDQKRDDQLMESVDRINRQLGKGTLFFGSQGVNQRWRSASDHCSPNYTLNFADLPVAKAK